MIEYIAPALASLKAGKETVKLMIDAPKQLEKTELQLNLASINKTLFESENALLESQKLLKQKYNRIEELEDLLKFKGKLVRKDGMYFETDENGDLIGDPYCSGCWDSEKKAVHLLNIESSKEHKTICPVCKLELKSQSLNISTPFASVGGRRRPNPREFGR
jgi:hypothetical protein